MQLSKGKKEAKLKVTNTARREVNISVGSSGYTTSVSRLEFLIEIILI